MGDSYTKGSFFDEKPVVAETGNIKGRTYGSNKQNEIHYSGKNEEVNENSDYLNVDEFVDEENGVIPEEIASNDEDLTKSETTTPSNSTNNPEAIEKHQVSSENDKNNTTIEETTNSNSSTNVDNNSSTYSPTTGSTTTSGTSSLQSTSSQQNTEAGEYDPSMLDFIDQDNSEPYSDDGTYIEELQEIPEIDIDSIDYSALSNEDIKYLVGNMNADDYKKFIEGMQAYYQSQIDYYDGIEEDLEGPLTDLNMIKQIFETRFNSNEEYKMESIYGYITEKVSNKDLFWAESPYIPEGTDPSKIISREEFERFCNQMTDEEQYEWIKETFPDDKEIQSRYESYLSILDALYNDLSAELDYQGYNKEDVPITSYKGFLRYINELASVVESAKNYENATYNRMGSCYYDYLPFLEDYEDLAVLDTTEITEEEIEAFYESLDSDAYSYKKYLRDNPESNCTPLHYMMIAQETIGLLDPSLIRGIDNVGELATLVEISDYAPELLMAYNYAYSQGTEKTEEFFKTCEYKINDYRGQLDAKAFLDSLSEKDDAWAYFTNNLGVSLEGLADGTGNFINGVGYSIEAIKTLLGFSEENRVKSADEYKKMYILQALYSEKMKLDSELVKRDKNGNLVNNVSGIIDYTKSYTGYFLSDKYEIAQGIGTLLPSMAISSINPYLGSFAMGISAGGNSYHNAMVNGNDLLSSFAYGIFTGCSASVSQRVFGALPGLSNTVVTSLKTYAQAMGKQAFQSVFRTFIDTTYQNFFLANGQKIPTTVEGWEEYAKSLGKQAIHGAITAGLLQAPNLISSLWGMHQYNATMEKNGISEEEQAKAIEKIRNSDSRLQKLTDDQIKLKFGAAVLMTAKVSLVQQQYGVNEIAARIMVSKPGELTVEQAQAMTKLMAEGIELELAYLLAKQGQKETTPTEDKGGGENDQSTGKALSGDRYTPLSSLNPEEALAEITRPGTTYEIKDLTQEQVTALLKSGDLTLEQITAVQALEQVRSSDSPITLNDLLSTQVSELSKNGIMTTQETLDYIKEGLKTGSVTEDTVAAMFKDLVGFNLASWAGNSKVAMDIYTNLLISCGKAGIGLNALQRNFKIMETMEDYYLNAIVHDLESNPQAYDAYRTHGIIHIFDVLTMSLNTYQVMQALELPIDLDSVLLAAAMHDTGMSGGNELFLTVDENNVVHIDVKPVQSDGDAIRKSHSYASGNAIIDNFYSLKSFGYSDEQIAKAALIAFAHSKSNSGLKPLSDNSAGWSFAIQALQASADATGTDINIAQLLVKAGILESAEVTDQYVKMESVASPNVIETDADGHLVTVKKANGNTKGNEIGGGKIKGALVPVYRFSEEGIRALSYDSQVLRIGDALTNNDNGLSNQHLEDITFNITDFSNQHTVAQILQMLNLSPQMDDPASAANIITLIMTSKKGLLGAANAETQEPVLDENGKPVYKYLYDEEGKPIEESKVPVYDEGKSVTFKTGEKVQTVAQAFVLGEANQTYGVRVSPDGKGMDLVIKIRDASHVPFCTLYAINERAEELTSKGPGIFQGTGEGSDGARLRLVILTDDGAPVDAVSLFEQYAMHMNSSSSNNGVSVVVNPSDY